MELKPIRCFADFCDDLMLAGFTPASDSGGVFSLSDWFGNEIQWHTEQPDTDPWEWRMRVLEERDDIAYGKFFWKKGGYITREWMPAFLAVRQPKELDSAYRDGEIGGSAKRIYDVLRENGPQPLHLLRIQAGFGKKEEKSRFERGLVELQMRLDVTICGSWQKVSGSGTPYGWNATVLCTMADYFGPEVIREAKHLTPEQAEKLLRERLWELNPAADEKKRKRFLFR